MSKPHLTPSLSITVLLALILVAFISSKRSKTERPSSPPHRRTSTTSSTPPLQQPSQTITDSKTSTKSKTFTELASNKLEAKPPHKNNPPHERSTEQSIRRLLSRSEDGLTHEILADGTELIHLNRSQGHLSAASLSPDGSIIVQCHSSPEALFSQTSPTPSTPALESGPTLLTK